MFRIHNYKGVQILSIIVLTLAIFSVNTHFVRALDPPSQSYYLSCVDTWSYDKDVGLYGGYSIRCIIKYTWNPLKREKNEDGCTEIGQLCDEALHECPLVGEKYEGCSSDNKSIVTKICKSNGWWQGMSQTKALLKVWNTEEEKCNPGYTCKLFRVFESFDWYAECVTAGQWCERCSNNQPCTKVKWYDKDGGCDSDWYNQRTAWTDNSCTNLCLQGQTCQNGICVAVASANKTNTWSFHSSQPFQLSQPSQPLPSVQSFHSIFHPVQIFSPQQQFAPGKRVFPAPLNINSSFRSDSSFQIFR